MKYMVRGMGKFGETVRNLRKIQRLTPYQCYGSHNGRNGEMSKRVEQEGIIPCAQAVARISKKLGANLEELLALAREEKIAETARKITKEYSVSSALNARISTRKTTEYFRDQEEDDKSEVDYEMKVAEREYRVSRCERY